MTDLLHSLTSGQSLSIGGVGGAALSTVSEAANACAIPSGGAPAPLVGTASQRPDLSMGYRLAEARPGRQLGFSTHGQGGQSIADLSPGGSTGLAEQAVGRVQSARNYAASQSMTYGVEPVFHWIHGEQDSKINTAPADYIAAMVALRSWYIDEFTTITGQDLTGMAWLMSQTASWAFPDNGGTPRMGLAQLDAARTLDDFYIVGGQYQLPYNDGQHPSNVGYYYLGELHARAHQAIIDGAGWAPFAPVDYVVTPSYVDVVYHVPTGALRFDTTTVPAQPHRGFSLHGTTATITAVSLVAANRVRLALNHPITEPGARVGYGVSANNGGVGLGNLCDSETAVSGWDSARLSNWACHSLDTIIPMPDTAYDVTDMYYVGPGGAMYPLDPVVTM